MPWKDDKAILESIPSLKALPSPAVTMYRQAANMSLSRGNSEEASLKIAWAVVKNKFKKAENGNWVARAGAFNETTYYTFSAERAEEFVTRTETGHIIHNYVLTDLWPDLKGTSPTGNLMSEWASWINEEQPEVDVDHQLFEKMKKQYGGNIELVGRAMKFKKGVAKAVSAFIDKGRLVVSLMFDKRYENHIDKFKGVSVEAAVERDALTNKWIKGKMFGFTLAQNMDPLNARAKRVIE